MKTRKLIYLTLLLTIGLLITYSCNKDDGCTEQTWYQDLDADGFGNPNNSKQACEQPSGYVSDNTDFDDTNATAYPEADELCADGIDNDGDGFTDCDDFDCDSAPNC